MEQCVQCQSVFKREDSDSTMPTALCSIKCENENKADMEMPLELN